MNINSKEDAKGMIEEVKAKGDDAIAKQLAKVHTHEMIVLIIKALDSAYKGVKIYDHSGITSYLHTAQKLLKNAQEMLCFAELAIEEDIQTATLQHTKPNNNGI